MVPSEGKSLPSFERPPIAEVVCSIAFESLNELLVPHLGLFWDNVKGDYPRCEEHPLLMPVIERFEATEKPKQQILIPFLPRTFFVSGDKHRLIQVQRDRFIHNWRKNAPDDDYPRYPEVIKMFRDGLAKFEAFLEEKQLGEIVPLQYELTYVNYIPAGDGWTTLADIGELLPDFAWRGEKDRFLPTPEGNNWTSVFLLPDRLGRLRVTIQNATRSIENEKLDVIRLDLTARGIGADKSRDAMNAWFELAHEWIVLGFVDLTGDKVQREEWGRS